MPAISCSAPGKAILFGEHAVVYGRPAVAVPIDQVRAKAIVKANPRGLAGEVHIQAPQIRLDTGIEALAEDHPLRRAVVGVLTELRIDRAPACTVRVTSTIPIAAGLGSGAAVTVAITRALASFLGHPLPDERVSALAYQVEVLLHGTPSGIDNTVVTYSRPVFYIKDQPIQTFSIRRPFTLVVGDTGISSPTAATVGMVRRSWQANPDRTGRLFDAIGEIARAGREAIENGQVAALGPLIDDNHRLLCELEVSSPELDLLVAAARDAGALGAKLSGGGRGGVVIALAPPTLPGEITRALLEAGARQAFTTTVRS